MVMPEINTNSYSGFVELGLKTKTEQELYEALFSADPTWQEEDKKLIGGAYNIARIVHADDVHRDLPYTYHLLRNANRATGYLHITDPEIISAVILHDSVEDHPDDIISAALLGEKNSLEDTYKSKDPYHKQASALKDIAILFTPRVAEMVASVTNPPRGNEDFDYEEWIAQYVAKVSHAVEQQESWVIKFVDWLDNGLGIIHGPDLPEDRRRHFSHKYSSVQPILEARFYRPDLQEMLDDQAKAYAIHQFELGRERLKQ